MKLHFKKFGDGDPVLILHGLFGMSDNWISIAKNLADNYQVYVMDMRNHGRSPHVNAFNYSDMIEDIYEFLTDMNLRRLSLIGHSMGGKIAMNMAMEYPHRINKLCVIDIAPREYPVFHSAIIEGLSAIDILQLKSRNEADAQLALYIKNPKIRQFLLKNLYRMDDGSFAWRINLPVIKENLNEIGAQVLQKNPFEKPTLFIRGSESDYITDSDFDEIKQQFPNSQMITVAGASHWVHSEEPEQVLSALQKFLQSTRK